MPVKVFPIAQTMPVTGTYTGDGTDDRHIPIGFQCSCVILWDLTAELAVRTLIIIGTQTFDLGAGESSVDALLHATDGFVVHGSAKNGNVNSEEYYYWAMPA